MARKKLTRADNVKLSTVRRLLKLLGVSEEQYTPSTTLSRYGKGGSKQ